MSRSKTRSGLRIQGARGHPVVRRALIRYARWLRVNYDFPIRVPVYLSPQARIIGFEGDLLTAAFVMIPGDHSYEPYISIATGDYPSLRKECGRDDALAAFLCSLSHEVVHYRQWIETGDTWEQGVWNRAAAMVSRYASTVAHP